MSTSKKILPIQEEKIEELIKDRDLRYTSKNDFVKKAVDNELRLATLKHGLSQTGKYHFDMMFNELMRKAYERAKSYDKNGSVEQLDEITRNMKKRKEDFD